MDSIHFKVRSAKCRLWLIVGIAVASVLGLTLLTIGVGARNIVVAWAILVPFMFVLFVGLKVLALLMTGKIERDSFEAGMRLAMETTPMACAMIDVRGNVAYCNIETTRLAGLENKSDCLKKPLADLMPELQPSCARTADILDMHMKKVFEKGITAFECWYGTPKSGKAVPCTLVRLYWPAHPSAAKTAYWHSPRISVKTTKRIGERSHCRKS